jgi:cellulose synthase/poly-beta-1,6-N-acetylglucosamine synthase-like glycosyltransferase
MTAVLYLFIAVLMIANLKLFTQLALSISYNLKSRKKPTLFSPKISVIVPAYNEEKTIADCIQSLLSLSYPDYEVVVVDDGSIDKTFQRAIGIIASNLRVIRQENQGKSKALNNGIKHSSGEIIVTVDADTVLENQALRKIADRFSSNINIGAVAGNVKVKAERTLLNNLQSAEYATGINLVRKGQSVIGCVMVVPGPVAALKRDVIERAGYFSDETFAEDFDLTLNVLRQGCRIEYEEESLAYTDAPKNIEDMIKQRRRWYRGMFQVLDKHKDMYFNRRFGSAGLLGVPNLWFEAISPFFNVGLLLIILLTWVLTSEVTLSLIGIGITLAVFLVVNLIILSLEPKHEKRNYLIMPLLLFYNVFLDGIRIMSLTEEMVNTVMEWEKPKR